MKTFNSILCVAFLLFVGATVISCSKDDGIEPLPDWWFEEEGGSDSGDKDLVSLETADNIVVAHRGGSTEAGEKANPDNSFASLRYAISLNCYASECDIYWTSDNNVIVAHADSKCQINGLYPWEHTLAEIQAAGKLSNGETVPSLGDYLDVLLKESKCTKLWMDIKNITYPSTLTKHTISACKRACEIITQKKANNCVEFICTGNSTVMASSFLYATTAGIPIGWMSASSPSVYSGNGYRWANLSYTYMTHDGGVLSVESFLNAGIKLSVFVIDDTTLMDYYISYGSKLKAITTNYPKVLLRKMGR